MSRKKDRYIRSRRAGAFPTCYGECGRCVAQCEFYAEWKADQQCKAADREAREALNFWDADFTPRRVN